MSKFTRNLTLCIIDSQASQLFNHALFLAVIFGVVICVLMEALAPQLLALMGTGPEYLKPALLYLRIRALSGTHSTHELL